MENVIEQGTLGFPYTPEQIKYLLMATGVKNLVRIIYLKVTDTESPKMSDRSGPYHRQLIQLYFVLYSQWGNKKVV